MHFLQPEPDAEDKLAAIAAPPAVQPGFQELTLYISKPASASLGVDLDIHESTLPQVCGIVPGGAAALYNSSLADEDQHLQVGDFLVCVNGPGLNVHALLRAIKEGTDLQIRVRRPRAFTVRLEREPPVDYSPASADIRQPPHLGICMNYSPTSASLLICQVLQGGQIHEHNLRCGGGMPAVQPMDRVVSVNGVASRGDVTGLLKQLYEARTLEMVLVRPGDPSPQDSHDGPDGPAAPMTPPETPKTTTSI